MPFLESDEALRERRQVKPPAPALRALLALGCVALLSFASASASDARGKLFPSLWLDAFGAYSMVSLPGWETDALGLSPLSPLVELDRAPVDRSGDGRHVAGQLEQALRRKAEAGARSVELGFLEGGAIARYALPLRPLGASEIGWYFALYALLGGSFLSSGALVLRVAARRSAAKAYFWLSLSSFIFFVTFFDYHTTRWLTPLFNAAAAGNMVALFSLSFSFPTPLADGPRARRIARALLWLGLLFVSLMALGPLAGLEVAWMRQAVTMVMPLALLALPTALLYRLKRAREREALELRAVLVALLFVPLFLALTYTTALFVGSSAFHLALPFVGIIVPASVGFALVRHNILAMSSALSRWMVAAPVGFCALALGGLAALTAMELDGHAGSALLPIAFGLCVALCAFQLGWRVVRARVFPAGARFRASMERLSDELKARRDPEALRMHLARVVRTLVTGCQVEVLEHAPLAERCAALALPLELLATRGHLFSAEDPFERVLLVPLRSGGTLWGALLLSPRESGAPLTEEELALLEVIASIGALALHNAEVAQQVEVRAELTATASREDRKLAIDILAAEVAHEIAYPLNYFRHLLRQLAGGKVLASEDIEIGGEELQRLERMLASLRKMQVSAPSLSMLCLRTVVERAVVVASEPSRRAQIEVEVPPELRIRADPDALLQVFSNLLRNALQASGEAPVGISAREEEGAVVMEVWDAGKGFAPGEIEQIFRAWYSNRAGGAGLGLAVTYRLVRLFGWTLSAERRGARTVFTIRSARVATGAAA